MSARRPARRPDGRPAAQSHPAARHAVLLLALLGMAVAVWMLERDRAGLAVERLTLAGTPVTLTRPADAEGGLPLVVVAHGYGGSRQMMRAFARALARAGLAVASYDALGHGRSRRPMSGDLTAVEGATERLVAQAVAVARAARDRPGVAGPVALLGHSMATDVVIRAAARLNGMDGVDGADGVAAVAAVVAVSMYSDAVTAQAPARLLILSGAREGRLREAALRAVRLVDPDAREGETARSGPPADPVARRAQAVPLVGHVGVLYAPEALRAARDWIAPVVGVAEGGVAEGGTTTDGRPSAYGAYVALLLAATVASAWPLAGLAGRRRPRPAPLGRGASAAAILLPVPAAMGLAVGLAAAMPTGALGLMGFGPLAAALSGWGAAQLAVLWRAGLRPVLPNGRGLMLLGGWSLLFALLLDRYGAAFLPVGPRVGAMALLLPGCLAVAIADAALARRARWPWRLAGRGLLLAALLGAMLFVPELGVAFTALPVLVLFWGVYGLAGRWALHRSNGAAVGLVLGAMLAWALAASTPMVAGG